ncbi:hypothetical protein K458DRAFT_410570 [Lentithecium fluviatile CBS 122367]|uniref:Uncharacterized protein n=1 Tax=Lentithecium fluviatile CBS 122367 TaxID=1168545 RepID=A0A6G1IDR9_9PLEO|nr:hypothetical protein K458DRAFT_410570 [Lentithecium fluviatile CBS 122367]
MEALLRLFFAWLGVKDDYNLDSCAALTIFLLLFLRIGAAYSAFSMVCAWYEHVCESASELNFTTPSLPGAFPASPPPPRLPRRTRRALDRAARRRPFYPPPPSPIFEHDAAWYIVDKWGPPSFAPSPVVRSAPVVLGRYDTFLNEEVEEYYASARRVQGSDGSWRWTSFFPEERKARLDYLAEKLEGKRPVCLQPASPVLEFADDKKQSSTPPPPSSSHEVLNDVGTAATLPLLQVEPHQNPVAQPVLATPVGAPIAPPVNLSAGPNFLEQFRQVCEEKAALLFLQQQQQQQQPPPPTVDFSQQFRMACEEKNARWPAFLEHWRMASFRRAWQEFYSAAVAPPAVVSAPLPPPSPVMPTSIPPLPNNLPPLPASLIALLPPPPAAPPASTVTPAVAPVAAPTLPPTTQALPPPPMAAYFAPAVSAPAKATAPAKANAPAPVTIIGAAWQPPVRFNYDAFAVSASAPAQRRSRLGDRRPTASRRPVPTPTAPTTTAPGKRKADGPAPVDPPAIPTPALTTTTATTTTAPAQRRMRPGERRPPGYRRPDPTPAKDDFDLALEKELKDAGVL